MILNFYILKRFLLGFLISLLVLVSIEIFFSFSSEMKYLNEGNYDFDIILKYIFLSIPRSIETMFPYSILIGALLSLGAMAADMEFVAMQSAGISVRKILTIVLLQTFLFLPFSILLLIQLYLNLAVKQSHLGILLLKSNLITIKMEHGLRIKTLS